MNTLPEGFTLLEYLITLGVIAILLASATPSIAGHIARTRLIGATEALANDLKQARSEAIRRNTPVFVHFQTGPNWCGGLNLHKTCECALTDTTDRDTCSLDVSRGTARQAMQQITTAKHYPGVILIKTTFPGNYARFDPVNGTAKAGTLKLQGHKNYKLHVVLSMLGRVRICAARNSNMGHWYPAC